MAEKQATIYIVDLGKSMGEKHHGRDETDLSYALRYVWDRITTTVSNERKTDMIGVIGLRTDASNNEFDSEEAYEHISLLAPISQFLMPQLRMLEDTLQPSTTEVGDGISALILAVHLIDTHCKKLKYTKNIVFVTNGTGSFDTDGIESLVERIKELNINITVLGVDFNDDEFGVKEEDKTEEKAENEAVLRELVGSVDGVFGTLEEAISELGRPRLKAIRPTASFKGKLTLGDTSRETAFAIDVERYPRTMIAKPPTASRYAVASVESAPSAAEGEPRAKELQAVRQAISYQYEMVAEAGGKVDLEKKDLEKGYKYGRTIVPMSKADEDIQVLETEQSMQIIGFIPADGYKRYHHMSTTNAIVAQKGNHKAFTALSSLIHALYEVESYALVRFVRRNNDAPVLMVLAPEIDADFECLIDVQVPFIEDFRPFRFPPLGKVKTVSGKILDKHRNIPTHEMEKFMSDYVDSMDISEFGHDDDGEALEYAPVEDSFSPIIHRINQVIKHRAIHPDYPLPAPYAILTKFSQPPKEVVEKSASILEKLIPACDVKKVDLKALSKKRGFEQAKPKSGLDVQALTSDTSPAAKKAKISMDNAIPEFKQKLVDLQDEEDFRRAGVEMFAHAKELIKTSMATINYARACEIIRTVREQMKMYELPDIYNDLLEGLKKDIVGNQLDGDRKEMWWTLQKFSLGLYTQEEGGSEVKVTEEDARAFWKLE